MEIAIKEIITNPIVFNFEDLKTSLEEYLKKYENLVFDECNMKDARDTRAELNKLKKVVDDKRKEVKKIILTPYTEFEAKVSELLAKIEQPILAIDSQIKTFDESERIKKEIEIKKIYDDNFGDLRDLISLEKIFDSKWYNKGTSLKDVLNDIQSLAKKVNEDLSVIDGLGSEFAIEIKNNYLDTLDLASTLRLEAKLKDTKKILNAEKEVVSLVGDNKIEEAMAVASEIIKSEETIEKVEIKEEVEEEYYYQISIHATVKKKDLFKKFLDDNKIEWSVLNQNGTIDE